MVDSMKRVLLTAAALVGLGPTGSAQLLTYPDPCLDFVYPAGGRQGQTVQVELGGTNGLAGADRLVIDGPPGVSAALVKAASPGLVKATLKIAADAAPGRRWLRVLGGANGLTNGRPFFVGTLSEIVEKEDNNTPATAQEVDTPVVVNGRIEKALDVDCFKLRVKAGQRLIAALLGHGMDSTVRISFNQGFLDTSLELLDEAGKVIAAADDTLGLDPVLEVPIQRDGVYTLRVQSLAYKGSAGSVYRLTLGDVPYATHVFPPSTRLAAKGAALWGGFNVPSAAKSDLRIEADKPGRNITPAFVLAAPPFQPTDGRDFPLAGGGPADAVEIEPNNLAGQATPLSIPGVVYGRFAKNDEDWFRISLKKGEGVTLEVTAQRHWRAPVDAIVEIFDGADGAGKKLAENDDGLLFARPNHCAHEFSSADSWLHFTAPADGAYHVRLRDQNNTGAAEAIYRLAAAPLRPELKLYHWPDAVPIWGPGSTAAFVVEALHWGGLNADLEVRVEGLPAGWTGSAAKLSWATFAPYVPPNATKALLTITAPKDAAPGALAEFRVVGKCVTKERTIDVAAEPLALYGNSHNDGMLLRTSPVARAVVAAPMDCWLETSVKEVTGKSGETVQIPVRVHRKPGAKAELGLVVNGPTVAAGVGLAPPRTIPADQENVMLLLALHPEWPPGTRGIVVARSWSSDIRAGRPGPCTPIIQLTVLPK